MRPGDEVIVVEPAYDSYVPAIQLNGGIPVFILKLALSRLRPGLGSFERPSERPHAPDHPQLAPQSHRHGAGSGIDLAALREITAERDLFILSDEVYEHILFDGREHQSMLRYPDLGPQSFVVSSFGKTYHATGWKIGYCVAPRG